MDAKRLEELAQKCKEAIESPEYWLDNFLQTEDIADLARCAAAWAKVERSINPMIERRNWPQGAKWYFRPGGRRTGSGDTAIAAVEAAQEVTDANKG
jgi:hypothetical protein